MDECKTLQKAGGSADLVYSTQKFDIQYRLAKQTEIDNWNIITENVSKTLSNIAKCMQLKYRLCPSPNLRMRSEKKYYPIRRLDGDDLLNKVLHIDEKTLSIRIIKRR